MKIITIGYFADGPWSHLALDRLTADPTIQIGFICARYDQPDNVLRERAGLLGIEYLMEAEVNSDESVSRLASFGCDLFVSMSFNQIFKRPLIEHPRLGTINCHAGKLPFYRGRNVLNWALLNDEREFGITVHYVDEGIDSGDIVSQQLLAITDEDNYSTLLNRAYPACANLLYVAVKQLQEGSASRTRQVDIHPQGFYCSGRCGGDERLNWDQPSRDVFNFVRAICRPGPEARTIAGEAELRINRVDWIPNAPIYKGIPGAVLRVDKDGFLVKTRDSFVKVREFSGAERVRIGDRLR